MLVESRSCGVNTNVDMLSGTEHASCIIGPCFLSAGHRGAGAAASQQAIKVPAHSGSWVCATRLDAAAGYQTAHFQEEAATANAHAHCKQQRRSEEAAQECELPGHCPFKLIKVISWDFRSMPWLHCLQ
jgi:hypothetical protein